MEERSQVHTDEMAGENTEVVGTFWKGEKCLSHSKRKLTS
jgi:hypothetical protein